jgi:transcriptional regulator with XRE-family HTH domain
MSIKEKHKLFLMDLGIHLKKIRIEKGLGLDKTAGLSKISPSQLDSIEKGNSNATIATLYSLSKVLEIRLSEMFKF